MIVPQHAYLKDNPEQFDRVEVIGKRIDEGDADRFDAYYITFRFSNGSEWALAAGRPSNPVYYDAIYIGDTGKLTYKDSGRGYRRFEKFEKDADYGGKIIEPYRRDDMIETVLIYTMSGVLIFIFLLALFYLLRRGLTRKTEQTAQVKVMGKRLAIFALEFPDGSVKEVHDPNINMQINDTGTLTYKERENIEKHIKREKARWRGRQFIHFEKDK